LFWKKKMITKNLFSFESLDKRSVYRVSPLPGRPIEIVFKGETITVKDLCAAGVSFFQKGFQVGDTEQVAIALPGEGLTVSARTEILDIDKKGICHCRFHGLDEASFNAIHRYILVVQVEKIRKKK